MNNKAQRHQHQGNASHRRRFLSILAIFLCLSTWIAFRLIPTKVKTQAAMLMGHGLLRSMLVMQRKTAFKVDYGFGYNIHFETTKEELQAYLPDHFRPMPMNVLEGQTGEERYLVSLYGAGVAMDFDADTNPNIPRVDVFTYIYDHHNRPALYFLKALTPAQAFANQDRITERIVKFITWFCTLDPIDQTMGYEHAELDSVVVDQDRGLEIIQRGNEGGGLRLETSATNLASPKGKLEYKHLFSRKFVAANNQIYRGKYTTRNVNFFNQDFLQVPVASISIDDEKLSYWNTTFIHPLCKKVVSMETYEGIDGPITWYFEFD